MVRAISSNVLIGALAVWLTASSLQAATLVPQNAATRAGLKRAWFSQVGAAQSTGAITYANLDHGALLVQTRRNLLSSLDPETGRMLWSLQVGPPNHLSTEPAANDKFAAVVNGSVLYVIDRVHGKLMWQKPLKGSPGAGPGISETHVFVPMVAGQIEGYSLEKGAKQSPWVYKSAGRVLTPPVVTAQSICWATERGYLYSADPSAGGVRYRLETRDTIHSRPAAWMPRLFACSTDGFVYSVDEAKGRIEWKFTVGDAIYVAPVAIEDKLFVVAELEGMYCLDAKTGKQLWFAPQINQFVSTSPTRVYACDRIGRLVVLDASSGTRLGTMPLASTDMKLVNTETDRIYLAGEGGVIQCLHEAALTTPVVYTQPPPPEPEPPAKGKGAGEKKEKASTEAAEEEMPADEPSADEPAAAMEDETPQAPADKDADSEDPFK